MSLIAKYATLEQQKAEIERRLQEMENDSRLTAELEFKNALEELMQEHGKSTADVINLLSPSGSTGQSSSSSSSRQRKPRKMKIYKNPNTGEVVETRGGNHKTLKEWKDEFGKEEVEGWLVRVED